MIRLAQLVALSAVLFAIAPVSAQHNPRHNGGGRGHESHGNGHGYGHEGGNGNGNGNHGGGSQNEVPELDPKSGASAFALLAGVALLVGSRRRRAV
jgi:MYXO-CTERM domain-containing protein